MNFPSEVTTLKNLTKYYFVSNTGTIYDIKNYNNGCDDAHKLTEDDPIKLTITYEETDISTKTTTKTTYLYLDSYIEDGDYWDINNHIIKPHYCPNITYNSLAEKYKSLAESDTVKKIAENGMTIDAAIKYIPYYFFFKQGMPVEISDTLKITNVSPIVYIGTDDIDRLVRIKAEEAAKVAANKILSNISEEVDSLTMTTKEKVE